MYIVFDIGGSKMRIATSLDAKTIHNSTAIETPKDFLTGFSTFIGQADALAQDEKIKGIAGGIAGLIKDNELQASVNLQSWVKQSFVAKLQEHYNCRVRLENDAAIGALGEAISGSGRNYSSVIYIAIGTGIGGAWVVDQKLQNEDGTFEPGHQFIDSQSKQDLEQQIKNVKSQKEKEKILAAGLLNAINFWPAEVIVLGGGQIIHGQWSLENIKIEMDKLSSVYKHNFKIVKAELEDQAGLYGALTLI